MWLIVSLAVAGCGTKPAPPPDLPKLAAPLPGPPHPSKPGVVEQVELTYLDKDGEPLDKVDVMTEFQAELKFQLIEPPEHGLTRVRVQIIAYVDGKPTIAWESVGAPIAEDDNNYRYVAELRSPPRASRQFFVRADLGDKHIIVEKELVIRRE